jgi:mono/diheme cytochrome c family protein
MRTPRKSISSTNGVHSSAIGLAPVRGGRSAAIGRLLVVVVSTIALILGITHAHGQSDAQPSGRSAAYPGNADNGKRLYMKDGCYECHSLQGQGSMASGPRIGPDPIPFSALVSYVRHPAGDMPPYSDRVISEQELADIYAFLESLPAAADSSTIPLLQ